MYVTSETKVHGSLVCRGCREAVQDALRIRALEGGRRVVDR